MNMSTANVRVPVEVSFVSFHDDDLPATNVAEYVKPVPGQPRSRGRDGEGPQNTFILTTGAFPQEITLTTRSTFANLRRIELALDEAKDIVVERSVAGGSSPTAASAAAAKGGSGAATAFEIIAECHLPQGAPQQQQQQQNGGNNAGAGNGAPSNLVSRELQRKTIELDPTGAGKGVRVVRLRILSGYSDFVGIRTFSLYGEESEQRVAVMESKAEVNM